MVLNMLTTTAMIRIGKTYGNLMVDVRTGSEKLKDRARRIVDIITGLDYDEADRLLRRAHWNVKAAVVMNKTGLSYPKAVSRIRKAGDQCAKRSAKTSSRACARCSSHRIRGLSFDAAASSRISSTWRCSCRSDAGIRVVTGPSPSLSPHPLSRSHWPSGSPRWRAESSPTPIESASRGTAETRPSKRFAFERRVSGFSRARCVSA